MREFLFVFKCGKQSKECESSSSVLSTVSYLGEKNARVLVRFLISAGKQSKECESSCLVLKGGIRMAEVFDLFFSKRLVDEGRVQNKE